MKHFSPSNKAIILFIILFLSNISILFCQNNSYLNLVPKNSTFVIKANLNSFLNKAELNSKKKEKDLYKELFSITPFGDYGKKINIKKSGLDLSSDIIVFSNNYIKFGYCLKISNENDFRKTVSKLSKKEKGTIIKDSKYHIYRNGEKTIVWDNEKAILNNGMGFYSYSETIPNQYFISLFEQEKNENNKFLDFYSNKSDLGLLITKEFYEQIYSKNDYFGGLFQSLFNQNKENHGDSFMYLNFENGRIKLNWESDYSGDLKDIGIKESFDEKIYSTIPQNPIFILKGSFNLSYYANIIKLFWGYSGLFFPQQTEEATIAEPYEEEMNIASEQVESMEYVDEIAAPAQKDEVQDSLISILNVDDINLANPYEEVNHETNGLNNNNQVFGQSFEDFLTRLSTEFSGDFVATIFDFNKDIPTMAISFGMNSVEYANKIEKDFQSLSPSEKMVTTYENICFLSTNEQFVNDLSNKTLVIDNKFTDKLKENIFYIYIDLSNDKFPLNNSLGIKGRWLLLEDIELKSNGRKGDLIINFKNKNTNALKQLFR